MARHRTVIQGQAVLPSRPHHALLLGDILLAIFEVLDLRSLEAVCRTCRSWNNIGTHVLWGDQEIDPSNILSVIAPVQIRAYGVDGPAIVSARLPRCRVAHAQLLADLNPHATSSRSSETPPQELARRKEPGVGSPSWLGTSATYGWTLALTRV